LRALYMGDNDFEVLSPEIKNFKNLQIVSVGAMQFYGINKYYK